MNRSPDDLVTVYVAMGRMEAELVRGRLAGENIPSILAYESIGQTFGLTMDGLGQVRVQVPAQFAEAAKELLSD